MEKFTCNTCNLEKTQYKYLQIYSGDWFGYICFDCIKEGLFINTDEGSVLIDFLPKLTVPGFD